MGLCECPRVIKIKNSSRCSRPKCLARTPPARLPPRVGAAAHRLSAEGRPPASQLLHTTTATLPPTSPVPAPIKGDASPTAPPPAPRTIPAAGAIPDAMPCPAGEAGTTTRARISAPHQLPRPPGRPLRCVKRGVAGRAAGGGHQPPAPLPTPPTSPPHHSRPHPGQGHPPPPPRPRLPP